MKIATLLAVCVLAVSCNKKSDDGGGGAPAPQPAPPAVPAPAPAATPTVLGDWIPLANPSAVMTLQQGLIKLTVSCSVATSAATSASAQSSATITDTTIQILEDKSGNVPSCPVSLAKGTVNYTLRDSGKTLSVTNNGKEFTYTRR